MTTFERLHALNDRLTEFTTVGATKRLLREIGYVPKSKWGLLGPPFEGVGISRDATPGARGTYREPKVHRVPMSDGSVDVERVGAQIGVRRGKGSLATLWHEAGHHLTRDKIAVARRELKSADNPFGGASKSDILSRVEGDADAAALRKLKQYSVSRKPYWDANLKPYPAARRAQAVTALLRGVGRK